MNMYRVVSSADDRVLDCFDAGDDREAIECSRRLRDCGWILQCFDVLGSTGVFWREVAQYLVVRYSVPDVMR